MGRCWKNFKNGRKTQIALTRRLVERNMGVNDFASEESEQCEGEPGKHMLSVLENT